MIQSSSQGEKNRPFPTSFYTKHMIILPRQARDKHREHSKTNTAFSRRGGAAPGMGEPLLNVSYSNQKDRFGEKNVLFELFYIKTIILPRQARDKHRENSKNLRFS
jgi:hypothetical protein